MEDLDFENFSYEDIEKLIEQKRNIVPQHIQEKVVWQVKILLEKFENSNIHIELKNSQILFRELPFTLKDNSLFVEGRIDIVYEKNGDICIMDFKTNRYETSEEERKIINQYQKQKEYYLKAISRLFPDRNINFKLGLLWTDKIILI